MAIGQNQNQAAAQAAPVTSVPRLAKTKLTSRTRGTSSLATGTYPFNGVQFGKWTIEGSDIPFLQFNTVEQGKRGVSLGAMYDAQLASSPGQALGEMAPEINPAVELSGSIEIIKSTDNKSVESIIIHDVDLSELYTA